LGGGGKGGGGIACGEEALGLRGLSRKINSQIVKIYQGMGGQSGKGVLVSDFLKERNVFNVLAEGLNCRDGFVEFSIPIHGSCNSNS